MFCGHVEMMVGGVGIEKDVMLVFESTYV